VTGPDRRLWLDPGFGASGDMVLGALIGLGAPVDAVRRDLDELDVAGWAIEVEPVQRAGISATRARVETAGEPAHHRAWSSIDQLLAASSLPRAVSAGARKAFRLLAEAEAAIHRVGVDEVHFHEVGAVDAIVDITGSWSALHHLAVTEVSAGPVGLGNGTVRAAHGLLPAPAPATLALLEGIPVRPVESPTETVTPTGAALLAAMVDRWGSIPAGRLAASSRGAGGRDPGTHPNVLTALLVEPATASGAVTAVVLATNLDDATPEIIGHTLQRLLDAGADDAWVVPIGMKKSRPGHELRVLCSPSLATPLRELVLSETGTLGVRAEAVTKHVAERVFRSVEVRGHTVRLKVGPHGVKPEHDDLVAVSEATGVPVRRLAQEAIRADSGGPM
jgi:uncharacterized protein (TIGR00299 family) protein